MTAQVRVELSVLEAAHLTELIVQFAELIAETIDGDAAIDDPAVARLVPDAYRDDPASADEFRRLTQADLLGRRRDDADLVLATLRRGGAAVKPDEIDHVEAESVREVALDPVAAAAWLRTLTAVRLVLATRLGIVTDDDHRDDPRFGVYDWLGYRLEGLLQAIDD